MNPVWGPKVTAHLTALLANGDQLAISDLTRLECQVGPLMTGNSVLLSRFTSFFESPDVRVLPMTASRILLRHGVPELPQTARRVGHVGARGCRRGWVSCGHRGACPPEGAMRDWRPRHHR